MSIILQKKNFSKGTLNAAITAAATSLTLKSGEGVKFPSSGVFRAVIWGSTFATPEQDSNREIVEAELDSDDTFTITRAQEDTTAYAWSADDNIALVITEGVLAEIENEIANKQDNLGYTPENVANKDQANGYVGLDSEGKISSSLLGAISPLTGDGSDGDVTISANTTLTRDMYYNNLTISAGYTLNTAGFKVFVKDTYDCENGAYVTANGNDGADGGDGVGSGVGGAAGAGGTATEGTTKNIAGGAGGRGANEGESGGGTSELDSDNGVNATMCIGGDGGDGGNGGNGWVYTGGVAGDGGVATQFKSQLKQATEAISLLKDINSGAGAAGGGGGAYYSAGGGGGGGASGVPVIICAKNIIHNGEIQSKGGDGGDGGDASTTQTGGGGGGGAGGHGGIIILIYSTKTGSGTTDVSGGTGGTGGTGNSSGTTGYNGGSGEDGLDGSVVEIQV